MTNTPDELRVRVDAWEISSAAGGRPEANGETPPPDAGRLEGDADPHRLARLFLDDHRADDLPALRYYREEWREWNGAAYCAMPDKELKAGLCERVKAEFDRLAAEALQHWEAAGGVTKNGKPVPRPVAARVTTRLVADVGQALTGMTVLPASVLCPAWLGGEGDAPRFPAGEMLACRGALIHLPSLADGKPYHLAPTPRFFSPNAVDYDFVPAAPPPREWLSFLSTLWPDDLQTVDTLQEWFGYCLLPDTSQQKILMVVGPKRSGKGTIARVLRGLVGVANTVSPTLAGLSTNFGLQPLLDKTIAIISDARLSGRTDVAVVTERLLSISGEDAVTIDRKNMSHVTAKLAVRFCILTNELPKLADPSGSLVSRLVVLRQTRSWYGQEDTALTNRLMRELPGILPWACVGWKRLRERGRFVQPESASHLIQEMEDLSSPIGAFVRECCEVGAGYEVKMADLYEHWRWWCEQKGRQAGQEQMFGRDLRTVLPNLGDRQPRVEGSRVRYYVGIRLQHSAAENRYWPPIGD